MRQIIFLILTYSIISFLISNTNWGDYKVFSVENLITGDTFSENEEFFTIITKDNVIKFNKYFEAISTEPIDILKDLNEVQTQINSLNGEAQINYISANYDITRADDQPMWAQKDDASRLEYVNKILNEITVIKLQTLDEIMQSNIKTDSKKHMLITFSDTLPEEFLGLIDINVLYKTLYKAGKALEQYDLSPTSYRLINSREVEYLANSLTIRFNLDEAIATQIDRFASVVNHYSVDSIKFIDLGNDTISLVLK